MFLLGILGMAVGIAASIALHELGHLLPAKLFGVRVPQYMVGFGPTLFSRRRGETEYGVKAIPLGGYVKLIGMYPPRPSPASAEGRFNQLIEDARQASMSEVRPDDGNRVFYALSAPKKVIVMLGGPMVNLGIALVLLIGVFTLHGIWSVTPKIGAVVSCADPQQPLTTQAPSCSESVRPTAAALAGLRVGDEITAIDGRTVTTWEQVRNAVISHPGRPLRLSVASSAGERSVAVTPQAAQLPVYDANGVRRVQPDGSPQTQVGGFLGASGSAELQRQSVAAASALLWDRTRQTISLVLQLPQKLTGVVQSTFTGTQRDPESPASVVGVGRIAGEVAASPQFGQGADRVATLVALLGGLNLALCVFNLIPLVPLDGGHVLGAIYEGTRRQWARLRRRSDPGPADMARMLPVAYLVGSLFIAMTLLLVYADIVNPIDIFS